MSLSKKQFMDQYLHGKEIKDLSDNEKRAILKKAKNHFIFYQNITKEPQITKSSQRYKDAESNMKKLTVLKDDILKTVNKN